MAFDPIAKKQIRDSFVRHSMPPKAIQARCHVLDENKFKIVEDFLVRELPWCYTSKAHVRRRAKKTSLSHSEILANKLPDPGSVMSGDFGEIFALFFLAAERVERTTPEKKWRYKQDRTKAAPHSDVVIFFRADSHGPSEKDFIICAESKRKATPSKKFDPISKAVEGYESDRTGRLARTLTWLREKAIDQEKASKIEFIDRFASDLSTEYQKYFKSVAIVDRALLDEELTRAVELPKQDASFEVIVLGISDLKSLYERVFARAKAEIEIE